MNSSVAEIISTIMQVFTFAIVARSLMSWFPGSPNNALGQALFRVTEPVLSPFRAILPRIGMFDLSPLAAIIVLQVVGGLVRQSVN